MDNRFLQEFKIPFVGMKKRLHQFEYLIGPEFFEKFDDSEFEKCAIEVKIDFDKRENFFLLTFYELIIKFSNCFKLILCS